MAAYSSLKLPNDQTSFRLFTINGSLDQNAPITGSLYISHLDDKPAYEALSYCWGSPETVEDVLINRDKSLPIAANLASALRALRLQHKSRVVWIDAICIDQSNVSEKNFQVQLMRRIYATCSRTVVWLGPSDAASRKAFKVIHKAPQRFTNTINGVLRRPWFRRVWVIQEVAFAPEVTVLCGEDNIEWDGLSLMCSRVSRGQRTLDLDASDCSKHLHPTFYSRILDNTRRKIKAGGRLSMLEALRSFRSFEATNGLDKVYGILGFLDAPELITVDYNRSLQDVFAELTLTVMRKSQTLDILEQCLPQETPVSSGLSSWVPDWTDSEQAVDDDIENFSAEEVFHASRDSLLGEIAMGQGGSLPVSAQFIATIAEIADPWPSVEELRDKVWPKGRSLPRKRAYMLPCIVLDMWKNWQDVARRINGPEGTLQDKYITNESMMEAYYNTFFTNAAPFPDFDNARKVDRFIHSFELLMCAFRWWQGHIALALPWPLVYPVSGLYLFSICMALLFLLASGRVVVEDPPAPSTASRSLWLIGRTNNGLLGLFPAPTINAPKAISSRPGDAVVIIKGAARPYVVRDEGKKWRLIGDCYVHGTMHGAAFEESKCVTIYLL